MGYSRYVGRVGALAVALGVGAAITGTPGVAWADETGDSTLSSASTDTSSSTATNTHTDTGTTAADGADDQRGSDAAEAQQPALGDETSEENWSSQSSVELGGGVVVSSSGGSVDTDDDESSDSQDATSVPETTPEPEVTVEPSPQPSSAPPESAAPQAGDGSDGVTPAVPSNDGLRVHDSLTTTVEVVVDGVVVPSALPTAAANPLIVPAGGGDEAVVEAGVETSSAAAPEQTNVVASVLTTLLSPFAATGPNAPIDSPALWGLLAFARREVGESATQQKAIEEGATGETGTALLMSDEATAALIEDPDGQIGAPDPVTGTVTGVVVPPAAPAGKKPIYTLVSQPTEGKFTFNKTTGAFSYTPTAAQRVIAGLSSETGTADFTVNVKYSSGGVSTPVTVSVPVSPTPLTDQGAIAAGGGTDSFAVTDTRAWVANSDEKTITVIDTINRTTVATIELDESPVSLTVTPDGRKLYVVDDTTNKITVIDTTTNTELAPIDFGENRWATMVTVSPDGKTLHAPGGLYNPKTDTWTAVVTKVSTTTGKITGTVKLPESSDVFYDLEFTPDGKKVYVVSDFYADDPDAIPLSALYSFSSTSTTATAKLIGVGTYIVDMLISADGKRAYINDVDAGTISLLDTKTDKVVDEYHFAAETLGGMTLNDDGSLLMAVDTVTASVLVFDTTHNLAQIATVHTGAPTGDYYPGIAVSPDSMELYYGSDNGLQVISLVPLNHKPVAEGEDVNAPNASGVVTGNVGITDDDEDPLNYTVAAGPSRGTVVVNADGGFTYTPTKVAQHAASANNALPQAFTDTFTVVVTDDRRGFATETITVDILPANTAPTYKVSSPTPTSSGVVKGSVTANDADKDALTITGPLSQKSDKGGTVTVDSKGRFTYTPTATMRHAAAVPGAQTTDTFTVAIADGHGQPVNATVTVKIRPLNAAPDKAKATLEAPNETTGAVIGKVTATDADGDGFTLTGPLTTKKGAITYNSDDDTFTYTPTEAARAAASLPKASSTAKTDTFTVTVNDGHGGTDTVTVKVNIMAVGNENPEEGDYTSSAPSASTGTVKGVVTADDPGNTLSYSGSQTTGKGKVTVSSDGSFTYTPTSAARHAAAAVPADPDLTIDTFNVIVSDGLGGMLSVPVTLTISPKNTAPSGIKATVGKPNATTGVVTGKVTASDADKDPLTYTATAPAKGAVTLNAATGAFEYTPTLEARLVASEPNAPAYWKQDTFTVTVTDAHGGTAEKTVTVTVAPTDPFTDLPVRWANEASTVSEPDPITGVASGNFTAVDDKPWTIRYSVVSGPDPAAGTLNLEMFDEYGMWTFTPNPIARVAAYYGDPGPRIATFTVKATDGVSQTEAITISIDVVPTAAQTLVTRPEGGSFTGAAVLGRNGTLYQSAYRQTDWETPRFESWMVGVRADGTKFETEHVVGGPYNQAVAGDYGVYMTVVDHAGQQIRIIGFDAHGTPVTHVLPVFGSTDNIPVFVNKFGVYRVLVDHTLNRTTVVTVAGAGDPITHITGTPLEFGSRVITGAEQGVYAVAWDSTTSQTRVVTIAGEGAPITIVNGRPGTLTQPAGLVAGPQGVYLTTLNMSKPETTVARIVGTGPASTVIVGYPEGGVVMGPNGVYQTTDTLYTNGDRIARMVTIAGSGLTLTQFSGEARGPIVVSDFGMYQQLYNATDGKTTVLRVSGGSGPASVVVDGYIHKLVAGTHGVYAMNYKTVGNGFETTLTTIAGFGTRTVTVPGSPIALVDSERGVYLTTSPAGKVTVTAIAGEGAPSTTFDGSTDTNSISASAMGVYQWAGANNAGTVYKIAGSGPASVSVPAGISAVTPAPDGTGYYVSSSAGIYFVDTIRQAPGAAAVVEDPSPDRGVVRGTVTAPRSGSNPVTYAVTSAPDPSIGAVTVNSATGSFTFTPTDAARHTAWKTPFADTATFTITATSGTTTTPVAVTATIAPTNKTPVASGFSIISTDVTTGLITGKVNVADPDGDALTYSVTTVPGTATGTVSVDSSTGVFVFTPSAAARHSAWTTAGLDTAAFVVTATDGEAQTSVDVSATILPANQAPVAGGFTIIGTDAAGVITGKVTVTDPDGDPVTYSLASSPNSQSGSLSLDSATGSFTYTPTRTALVAAWGSQTPPVAEFTVTATDGDLSTTVAVSAPITPSAQTIAAIVARSGSVPSGVTVGPDGRLYVINAGANSISIFAANGAPLATAFVGATPSDLAITADGRVFVTNAGDGTVSVLDSNATGIGGPITVGVAPIALISDASGRVFVANAGNGTVSVIEPGASVVGRTITVGGTPSDVVLDGNGLVYVADFERSLVTVFDPAADYASRVINDVGLNPYRLAIGTDGRLYATNPSQGTVTIVTPGSGSPTTSTVTVGGTPSAIALRADGTALVTDSAGSTVTAIDPHSLATTTLAVESNPNAIAIGSSGTVYVTNAGSNSVSVVDQQSITTLDVGVDTANVTVSQGGTALIVVDRRTGATSTLYAGWQPPAPAHPAVVAVIPLNMAGSSAVGAMATSPDGMRVYAVGRSSGGTSVVSVLDAATATEIGRVTLNLERVGDMVVSPDSKRLYVVGDPGGPYGRTQVVSIDVTSLVVVAHVPFAVLQDSNYNFWEPAYARGVAISPDGRHVYATSTTLNTAYVYNADGSISGGALSLVLVVDTTTNSAVNQVLIDTNYAGIGASPDGSTFYATGTDLHSYDGHAWLSVFDADTNSLVKHVRLGNHGGDDLSAGEDNIAFTSNGAVAYVANTTWLDSGGTAGYVTKVNALTGAEVSSIRATDWVSDIAISPNDRYLFVTGSNTGSPTTLVSVIDTATNTIVAQIPVGNAADIAVSADGRRIYAMGSQRDPSTGAYHSYVSVIDMDIAVPPPPQDPTPPDPEPPIDPTRPDYGDVPASLAYLWKMLKDKTTDGNDTNEGIYIQTVEGADGKHRLVVYLGGTTTDWLVNQGILENLAVAAAKSPKPEHIAAINDAITKCTDDSECGEIAEVMLVGYSQGGIDAQNLAWRGSSTMVTTVITFGSPLLEGSRSDDVTLHVQDVWDEVVNLTVVHPLFTYGSIASAGDVYLGNAGTIFQVNPFDLLNTSVHGNGNTYLTLSTRLDSLMAGPNTQGKLGDVESALTRFKGVIRDETEGVEGGNTSDA